MFLFQVLHVFGGDEPAGLNYIEFIVLSLFDANLGFHEAVLFAVCNSVVVLAVRGKPLDYPLKVLFTEITPGAHDLDILKDVFFIGKLTRDVLLVVVEDYPYFLLLGLGCDIGVKRNLTESLFAEALKDLGCIFRICQSSVKRNIFFDAQLVNGRLKAPSGFSVVIGKTVKLLDIVKSKGSVR